MLRSQPPIHPLFPVLDTASTKTDHIYSDHLPICTTVPIGIDGELRMLSYNVMGAGAENNLTRIKEDQKLAIARYQRIAKGLEASAKNLKLDVIVLQEVSSDLMAEDLLKTLGKDWDIYPSLNIIQSNPPQQLTFYNTSRLTLIEGKDWDPRKKTLSTTFKTTDTDKTVHIHNVWSEYDILPLVTEKYYLDLLMKDKKDGEYSIILGDTNSRLAPVHDLNPMNLATGIIPYPFNSNYDAPPTVQVGDHPDGGFYIDDKKRIQQLTTKTVDIISGELKSDDRPLQSIIRDDTDQRAVFEKHRAILCLDDEYKKKEYFNIDTVFEYEDKLRKILGDDQIAIRLTSNLMNERGFVIRFKKMTTKDTNPSLANIIANLWQGAGNPIVDTLTSTSKAGVPPSDYPCLFIRKDMNKEFLDTINFIQNIQLKIQKMDINSLISGADETIKKAPKPLVEKISFGLTLIFSAGKDKAILPSYEILLNLLTDEKTGHDLKSYRYCLASYFVDATAKNDDQAHQLIQFVAAELKMKIGSLPKEVFKSVSRFDI